MPAWVDGWSDEQVRSVLTHELAHVCRRDWLAQMVGEFCRTVYWFHPLVWFACAQLRKESELASDNVVLASGVEGAVYAGHVLGVARASQVPTGPPQMVLAMARPSSLERRFISMLNPSIDRSAVRVSTAFSIIGAIQSLRVLNTQIDPDLAKAAVEAISEWVYEPTLLNGEPVAVITEIAVNFALAK